MLHTHYIVLNITIVLLNFENSGKDPNVFKRSFNHCSEECRFLNEEGKCRMWEQRKNLVHFRAVGRGKYSCRENVISEHVGGLKFCSFSCSPGKSRLLLDHICI